MENYRFLHQYRLRFGTGVPLSQNLSTNSSFTVPVDLDKNIQDSKGRTNAYELTTHQISFTIKKDNNKEPNSAEITIFNLDDNLVNYIKTNVENYLVIILEAGWVGEVKTVFKGTVAKIIDKWERETRQTTLKCADGAVNVKEALTSRTYPAGTSYNQIFNDLAKDLGTPVGRIEIDSSVPTTTTPVSFVGGTSNQLGNLASGINHSYSIQDGSIYVLPNNKRFTQQSAYLSDETGLKQGPEPLSQGEKKSKKNKTPANGVSLECQLDGAIIPDSTIYVKARGYDGAFRVTKVTHKGSYEESEWTTRVEAVPIDATISKQGA